MILIICVPGILNVTSAPVDLPIAKDDPFYRRESMTKAMPHYHEKYRFVESVENAPPISFGRMSK